MMIFDDGTGLPCPHLTLLRLSTHCCCGKLSRVLGRLVTPYFGISRRPARACKSKHSESLTSHR